MKIVLKIVVTLAAFGFFCWLVLLDINPSGILTDVYTPGKRSPYVSPIQPAERVSDIQRDSEGDVFVTVQGDPAYVTVSTPERAYDSVRVRLLVRQNDTSFFEFGPAVDVVSSAYDLQPGYSTVLESLGWPSITNGEVTLYQRRSVFDSISAFFDALPSEGVATYHADIDEPFRLASYVADPAKTELDVSLRGYHAYKTYIKNEPLTVTATFMDMNRVVGQDTIELRVLNEVGELVKEVILEDDQNETKNQISSTRTISLDVPDLVEGVYTVELVGTSDIFWRNIVSDQTYMVFVDRLNLADEVGYKTETRPNTFFTNAKDLVFETLHAEGIQVVQVGSGTVSLESTHEKVRYHVSQPGLVRTYAPEGDMNVTGDGLFAFSEASFFNPDLIGFTARTDVDERGIDYLLTSYTSPVQEGNWQSIEQVFSLEPIKDEEGVVTFALSLPLFEDGDRGLDIHAIEVTFTKNKLNTRGVIAALRDLLPFGI